MAQELPTPETGYKAPLKLKLDRTVWDLVFGSINSRLLFVEEKAVDFDAATQLILTQALAIVTETISEEVQAGRLKLEEVQQAFDELQSGGFSATRIAATLEGQTGVTNVQEGLNRLLSLMNALGVDLRSRLDILEIIPTEAEARAGTENSKRMTALRVAQAIDTLSGAEQTINVTASLTAVANKRYRLIGATARTITLPSTAATGSTIGICDGETTVNHTIARGTRTIMGLAENLILDQRGYDFTLWWTGTTWRLF